MGSKIDTAIFDLGGVLIDWSPYHLYRKLFNSDADIDHFFQEIDFFNYLSGIDADRPFRSSIEELAAQKPYLAQPILAYWHRWPETIKGTFDDTLAVVTELREQGIPLYVISNWSSETWQHAKTFPFLEWFNGIVISGLERVAKPNQLIFKIACERYNLRPENCVFIDDIEDNVSSASNFGFRGIQFQDARRLRNQLVELGLLT